MTAKLIMSVPHRYDCTETNLMLEETQAQVKEGTSSKAVVTHSGLKLNKRKYSYFDSVRHFVRDYCQKGHCNNIGEQRTCYKRNVNGHRSKNCRKNSYLKNEKDNKTAAFTFLSATVNVCPR